MFTKLIKTVFPSFVSNDFIPDYESFERSRENPNSAIEVFEEYSDIIVPNAGPYWDYLFGTVGNNQKVDPLSQFVANKISMLISEPHELMTELPVMPNSVVMVMTKLQKDDFDLDKLLSIVETEPAIATELLSLANSPRYRRSEKDITDLKQAFMTLGAKGIKEAILEAHIRKFSASSSVYFKQFGFKIWQHSHELANVCQILAQNSNKFESSLAFLIGLVLNLGNMLIYQLMVEAFKYVDPEATPSSSQFKHLMKTQSLKLTVAVAKYWQLPQEVISVLDNLDKSEYQDEFTRLIHEAELICQMKVVKQFPTLWKRAQAEQHEFHLPYTSEFAEAYI